MSETIHVVLDFEMNPVEMKHRTRETDQGVKRLASELIEIGAVKLSDAYEKLDEFEILIRPEFNTKVEENITRLTGIGMEDLEGAPVFAEALRIFAEWVGGEPACIYSWSNSDLQQLWSECAFKETEFPAELEDWKDFQAMFPKITEIHLKRQMSLESAAEMAGINFESGKAHRALYDAKITAELVQMVLTGRYLDRMAKVRDVIKPDVEHSTFSLGDKFGAQLAALFGDQGDQG